MKKIKVFNLFTIYFLILISFMSCSKNNTNKATLPVIETNKKEESIALAENTNKNQDSSKKITPKENKIIDTNLQSENTPRISATIKAENQSKIGFLTSGSITKLYVHPGDEVKQGQILASLEDNQAKIDVKMAKIEVEKKNLDVIQQEKNVQRIEQQYKNGIVNLSTLEKEKNLLQLNKLELNAAQVQLEGKEYTLKSTQLTAPYAGIITQSLQFVGDYVSTGSAIFQISQMNNFKLYSQIPITYFNQLKVGMKLEVKNPITGNKGEATINRVVQVIDPITRTFDIYADVTSFSDKLAPGVFLEILLKSI
ncbi:efflux RND transporter periplasmic adaptor subunit [Silvanigrella aquatica]|uniref:Multidrug resistance protein MdtA-like barrel-sandwich hybrid domain-containing protein n=1 Tax=Silvanigrella aquatica TaxID=1915309 RepID=A0A1L4CX87_9BACT|nr:efflux RND transporter periplasmic adaptor subunit [Silvanigrella aquatica]APJ02562.1 hypothetical protein AXG55_00880 [Silvanigrella aquatica]